MEKLFLLLVEAALETVPPEIEKHPAVVKEAARRRKKPNQLLLDRTYHHFAMKNLPNSEKRGRPDIIHFCLLEALGSPLNEAGLLETIVSTQNGYTIYINPAVRLPRVYERFKGVFEKLFVEGVVKSESGETLLRLERKPLSKTVEDINPSTKILMSEHGRVVDVYGFVQTLKGVRPLVMVGCFPHGDFTEETKRLADETVSIHRSPLEAWTVVSRTLCFVEQRLKHT